MLNRILSAKALRRRCWAALIALCLPLFCVAQTEADSTVQVLGSRIQISIGYLSYDSVLTAMPQYLIVEKQMAELRQAYEAELRRVEDDFNQKYEAFLEGRKDYPRTILLKRQTELQQLLEHNVAFKEQSRTELEQARRQAMAPLHQQLDKAIAVVARRHALPLVVNTDARACPFIDPSMCLNLTDEVLQLLDDPQQTTP